jgi:acid phosphatase (class A)
MMNDETKSCCQPQRGIPTANLIDPSGRHIKDWSEMKSIARHLPQFTRALMAVALGFLLHAGPACGADHPPYFMAPDAVDVIALLPPPPVSGSPEQLADMAAVANARNFCPSNDLAVALEQNRDLNVFNLAPFLGANFKAARLPKTARLFRQAQSDTAQFVVTAKKHWQRLRPSVVDTNLLVTTPALDYSYPSGHSAEATVMALILMELVPDQSDRIFAASRAAGWHRVQLARHYPSDIQAGRVVAQAAFQTMKKNPQFQREFAGAKTELATALAVPLLPLLNSTNTKVLEPVAH